MKEHDGHVGTLGQQPRDQGVPGRKLLPAQGRVVVRPECIDRVPDVLKRHRPKGRDANAEQVPDF